MFPDAESTRNFAIGMAILSVTGPAFATGRIVGSALEGVARNPEATNNIRMVMILGVAFAEALGILAAVIALMLTFGS